jgi:dienelactone hydrolase
MTGRHGASHEVFTKGFYAGDRDYTVRGILGQAVRGGADAGEVLATIAGVGEHDERGWYEAWFRLGQRVGAIGDTAAADGRRASAASAYLRAANYLAVAAESLQSLEHSDELLPTFRAHRAAWEGFVDATAWDAERFRIPLSDGISMPAWFFRPDATGAGRPTLVMVNGSDGSISALWGSGAEAALERGYNVLLFDGPGQQSLLFEQNVPFRPDWQNVLAPVVDALIARDDVDAASLAVYGISQGGFWVPRALADEHRFAAAIADPGVVDVSASWRKNMPHSLLKALDAGDTATFDRDMAFGMKMPGAAGLRATWAFRARPYGTTGYAETLQAVSSYRLGDDAARIATPLLLSDPEDEQFWPGQSAALAAAAPDATLVRFTAAEGANFHCQPMGRSLTEQRMFDWLDTVLAR